MMARLSLVALWVVVSGCDSVNPQQLGKEGYVGKERDFMMDSY